MASIGSDRCLLPVCPSSMNHVCVTRAGWVNSSWPWCYSDTFCQEILSMTVAINYNLSPMHFELQKEISYDDVNDMTYLHQCFNEATRLYPPAPRYVWLTPKFMSSFAMLPHGLIEIYFRRIHWIFFQLLFSTILFSYRDKRGLSKHRPWYLDLCFLLISILHVLCNIYEYHIRVTSCERHGLFIHQ